MKKNYETPQIKVMEFEPTNMLLSSYIPVGGSGPAKARENNLFDGADDEY